MAAVKLRNSPLLHGSRKWLLLCNFISMDKRVLTAEKHAPQLW